MTSERRDIWYLRMWRGNELSCVLFSWFS